MYVLPYVYFQVDLAVISDSKLYYRDRLLIMLMESKLGGQTLPLLLESFLIMVTQTPAAKLTIFHWIWTSFIAVFALN